VNGVEISKDGKITMFFGKIGGINARIEPSADDELKNWITKKNAD
jgi:hypothetical protein